MNELTTSEAVREFRMHPATVLRLILTRRVAARKDGNGRWLIPHADLEAWNRTRVRRDSERTTIPAREDHRGR
ncbi:MAG: helix-turn-helix domain-containing protein [Candidatus Acidiferrum sp.]